MTDWQVLVRDAAGAIVGPITTRLLGAEFRLRLNDAGTWSVTLPADDPLAAALAFSDGARGHQGLALRRDGTTIFSGVPLEPTTATDADGRTLDVQGIDDTGRLEWALAYPNPATAAPWSQAFDTRTGHAETLLHAYVSANVGPAALPARAANILPGLAMGPDSGRGSVVTKQARLHNLLAWCQEIAAPDELRFEVVQSDTIAGQLVFRTSQAADRTDAVVFARERGTVSEIERTEGAASANAIVAGGQGEGTARAFAVAEDAASIARYGRKEAFLDRRNDQDVLAIGAAIAEALDNGRGGSDVTFVPLDGPSIQYGRDYELGDRVSAIVDDEIIAGYVSEIVITFDGDRGVTVTPVVTSVAIAPSGSRGQPLARLGRRLTRLEALAETWTRGQIVLWGRALAELPGAWQVCDGTNGTPDLRDRYLPAAGGAYALFATFGSDTSTIPTHTHTLGTAQFQHQHTVTGASLAHAHTTLASALAHAHTVLGAALSHGHTSPGHHHDQSHSHGINHDHASFESGIVSSTTAGAGGTWPGVVTNQEHKHTVDVPAFTGSSATDSNPTLDTAATVTSGGPGDISSQSGQPASNPATQSGGPGDIGTQNDGPVGPLATNGSAAGATVDTRPLSAAVYYVYRL